MKYTADLLKRARKEYPVTNKDSLELGDRAMIRWANHISNAEMRELDWHTYQDMRMEHSEESETYGFRLFANSDGGHKLVLCDCGCECGVCFIHIECGECECEAEYVCDFIKIKGKHHMDANGNPVELAEVLSGLAFNADMGLNRAMTILYAIHVIQSRNRDIPFTPAPEK